MTMRGLVARALAAFMVMALWAPLSASGAGAQLPPAPCPLDRPCRLSLNLADAALLEFQLAPSGGRAVFAHTMTDATRQLYSVRVGGGAFPVKLNVPAANRVDAFVISPDGARVLYIASVAAGEPRALFSVPIAGPASANIRLASNVGANFARIRISPDGRKVVHPLATVGRLVAVPIEGPASAQVRLTDPFAAGGNVGSFEISADSESVVYSASQDTNGVAELYRVPLGLSPAPDPPTVKLSGPMAAGGDVRDFRLAAGNGPVVYSADQDTNDKFELYSVRLGGAGRVKLNRALPTSWDVPVASSGGYRVAPDGSRVVYATGDNPVDHPGVDTELHSVPTGGPGSASVRLDLPPGTGDASSFQVTADSARVVYSVLDGNRYRFYRVPTAGPASASVPLSSPSLDSVLTLSPDGLRLIWVLDPGVTDPTYPSLWSTPVAAPAQSVRLNGNENPQTPMVNATSTQVVYAAGFSTQLFSAPIDGDGSRYNLTQSLDPERISQSALTPSGHQPQQVVYAAQQDPNGGFQLYSSGLAAGAIVLPPD